MPTPPTLDIADLLTPISEDQPAGPALRQAADRNIARIYLSVRDARKKAVDAERRLRDFASMSEEEKKGEPSSPEPADWEAVRVSAVAALGQSKDLWVTAWLVEALVRLHGFAGLRDGVLLAHQLCDKFWPDIHPQPDKDQDMANRFAQLAGLDGGSHSEGTLIAPILGVPMTSARTMPNFSFADYRDALELERKPPDIRRRRVEQGALTLDMFTQAVAETRAEFFGHLVDDLTGASDAFIVFNAFVRDKETTYRAEGGQAFAPPSSNIREALAEYLRVCRASAKDKLLEAAAHDPSPDAAMTSTSSDTASGTRSDRQSSAGAVETRQEAFETLLRVSEYFRRTEPHSPISYALEQAVRWGRMSFPELLSELVSDQSAREEIFRRAGVIQPPGE